MLARNMVNVGRLLRRLARCCNISMLMSECAADQKSKCRCQEATPSGRSDREYGLSMWSVAENLFVACRDQKAAAVHALAWVRAKLSCASTDSCL